MSDGINMDFSELDRLVADLGEVPKNIGPFVRGAVVKGAIKLRDDARGQSRGMPHAPLFPNSITYDVKGRQAFGVSQIEAEVGPDKERPQGALGNLIEYGSKKNPPMGILHGALQREEEDFASGLAKAEVDARKKSNL